MLFDYLVAILAQKLKNLDNFKDNVIGNIFEKNLDFWKNFKFFFIFQIFLKFQGDLQERVFELWLQPSSQKVSKLLKQFIGINYMGARDVARALRAKMEDSRKADFQTFL